jgi:hypothetical protein
MLNISYVLSSSQHTLSLLISYLHFLLPILAYSTQICFPTSTSHLRPHLRSLLSDFHCSTLTLPSSCFPIPTSRFLIFKFPQSTSHFHYALKLPTITPTIHFLLPTSLVHFPYKHPTLTSTVSIIPLPIPHLLPQLG